MMDALNTNTSLVSAFRRPTTTEVSQDAPSPSDGDEVTAKVLSCVTRKYAAYATTPQSLCWTFRYLRLLFVMLRNQCSANTAIPLILLSAIASAPMTLLQVHCVAEVVANEDSLVAKLLFDA